MRDNLAVINGSALQTGNRKTVCIAKGRRNVSVERPAHRSLSVRSIKMIILVRPLCDCLRLYEISGHIIDRVNCRKNPAAGSRKIPSPIYCASLAGIALLIALRGCGGVNPAEPDGDDQRQYQCKPFFPHLLSPFELQICIFVYIP